MSIDLSGLRGLCESPKPGQHQGSLNDQLKELFKLASQGNLARELLKLANQNGLYDAADWIKNQLS